MLKISSFICTLILCANLLSINSSATTLYDEDYASVSSNYGKLENHLSCLQEDGYPIGYREFDIFVQVQTTAPKLWFEIEAIPYPTGGNVVDEYYSWGYNTKTNGGYLESHHWSSPKRKVSVYGCGEVRNSSNTYAKATYTSMINV